MDSFLQHIIHGTNYATGTVGTPVDFVSFHAKGQPTVVNGHVRMGISKQLETADEAFVKIGAVPELAHTPIVIGENDPEGCAACPGAQNAYRNGTLYASYTAASYARLWELARERHANLEGALTWAFTFVGQPWFAGYRQLATNGVDLPVLNVFRMFARLGPDQLAANSSSEVPLAKILSDGVGNAPDVGVLATRGETGRVDILLWHYHDDDVPGPLADIHLAITALAPGQERQARVWRVDREHGDAFTAWQEMGSPLTPTKQQVDRLTRASRVLPQPLRIPAAHNGSLRFDRSLPRQSVELIELGR